MSIEHMQQFLKTQFKIEPQIVPLGNLTLLRVNIPTKSSPINVECTYYSNHAKWKIVVLTKSSIYEAKTLTKDLLQQSLFALAHETVPPEYLKLFLQFN